MKKQVSFENIIKHDGRSFLFREERVHHTYETALHYHPEYELAYLSRGGGVRCVNDFVDEFDGEDIVFVPGGIPHCWVFDPMLCPDDGVIRDCFCQFSFDIIDRLCAVMPELYSMARFYRELKQAIKLTGSAHQKAALFFDTINNLSEPRQALSFVWLLNDVYESGEYKFIGSPDVIAVKGLHPRMKFNVIQKLITENYARTISLEEAAGLVGMNKTAFCNAFRRMYGISFIKYLTHYRMRVAVRLLETTAMNISEIAYKVGFNDVPHFNRVFSDHFHTTPTGYRRDIGTVHGILKESTES